MAVALHDLEKRNLGHLWQSLPALPGPWAKPPGDAAQKSFPAVPGRGWECSWAALGSVKTRSNPGGEQLHSVNVSFIPFSISKLSCVKSLT